jgi:hypothetical protein
VVVKSVQLIKSKLVYIFKVSIGLKFTDVHATTDEFNFIIVTDPPGRRVTPE